MKFKDKLEEVAKNSLYTTFTNSMTIEYSFEIFKRHIKPGNILELGPAEGLMTEHLMKLDPNMYAVDGSEEFCEALKVKHPSLNVIHSLFEVAELDDTFDNIILGHVLEHVEDPVLILNHIKKWLKPGGLVLCAVPNARSIHRQIGVSLKMIPSVHSKSEKDKHHGHMRVYSIDSLVEDFMKTDYTIIKKGGYWLKPLSDSQIEKVADHDLLDAFMRLGEFYPDIAAEIYVVASL